MYRQFLRVGKFVSKNSLNHGLYIISRSQKEFREKRTLLDPAEIEEEISLAHVYLETLEKQKYQITERFGQHREKKEKEEEKDHVGDKFW